MSSSVLVGRVASTTMTSGLWKSVDTAPSHAMGVNAPTPALLQRRRRRADRQPSSRGKTFRRGRSEFNERGQSTTRCLSDDRSFACRWPVDEMYLDNSSYCNTIGVQSVRPSVSRLQSARIANRQMSRLVALRPLQDGDRPRHELRCSSCILRHHSS